MAEKRGREKVFITGGAGFIGANIIKYRLVNLVDTFIMCCKPGSFLIVLCSRPFLPR